MKPNASTNTFALAARCARGVEKSRANQRARGMPDARCIRGPVCKMGREDAHEHTGSAEASDIPCAMALRLTPRSPRRRIRLVTVVGELTAYPRPVGPTRLRQLDTSNGCQDHTALPSAAIAVRQRAA